MMGFEKIWGAFLLISEPLNLMKEKGQDQKRRRERLFQTGVLTFWWLNTNLMLTNAPESNCSVVQGLRSSDKEKSFWCLALWLI